MVACYLHEEFFGVPLLVVTVLVPRTNVPEMDRL
jgi:hypothetical protein